jgi:hypothetical protein
MSLLVNAGIRLILSTPPELEGLNIFGTITSRRKNSLFITLSKPLEIAGIKSAQIELQPVSQHQSLSALENYATLEIQGVLILPASNPVPVSFTGTATLD